MEEWKDGGVLEKIDFCRVGQTEDKEFQQEDFSVFLCTFLQYCFICRHADSTGSEDAGRTVATLALAVGRNNPSNISHPLSTRSHPQRVWGIARFWSHVSLHRQTFSTQRKEREGERKAKGPTRSWGGGARAKEDDSLINPLRCSFLFYSLCAAKDALQEA